jgi:predicted lipoprotein with Yx(FWY)xxD motif
MPNYTSRVAAILLAGVLLAACSHGPPPPASASLAAGNTSVGSVLVDSRGMTLYTYTEDQPGESHCSGMCADYWPPALAAAGAQPSGDIGLVTLEDGRKQWAYKNMPLYTYVKDKAPGDATGEGAEGEWYVVKQ